MRWELVCRLMGPGDRIDTCDPRSCWTPPKGSVQLIMIQPFPIDIRSGFEFVVVILQELDKRSRSHTESIRDPLVRGKKTFYTLTEMH